MMTKGGLAMGTCSGCLNHRPINWLPAGWSGATFCPACSARIWMLASGSWKKWQADNLAYLASIGWTGRPQAHG